MLECSVWLLLHIMLRSESFFGTSVYRTFLPQPPGLSIWATGNCRWALMYLLYWLPPCNSIAVQCFPDEDSWTLILSTARESFSFLDVTLGLSLHALLLLVEHSPAAYSLSDSWVLESKCCRNFFWNHFHHHEHQQLRSNSPMLSLRTESVVVKGFLIIWLCFYVDVKHFELLLCMKSAF